MTMIVMIILYRMKSANESSDVVLQQLQIVKNSGKLFHFLFPLLISNDKIACQFGRKNTSF